MGVIAAGPIAGGALGLREVLARALPSGCVDLAVRSL